MRLRVSHLSASTECPQRFVKTKMSSFAWSGSRQIAPRGTSGRFVKVPLHPPRPKMADQAVRTGLTLVTDALRTQLIKVIDQTKKLRNYGSVFAEPVDYLALGLSDYLEVIKRPMDLATLRSNLMGGEYVYLHQFLKDADLVWSNCRVYNGGQAESFFLKAADECEKAFQNLLCRVDQLGLTPEQHRILL